MSTTVEYVVRVYGTPREEYTYLNEIAACARFEKMKKKYANDFHKSVSLLSITTQEVYFLPK